MDTSPRRGRREQPWPIRLTHWLNVPLLVVMAGSGLQILAAYNRMGPKGREYGWYALQEVPGAPWALLGGWLAGGRALHNAFGWFLVINAVIYLVYVFATGEWRERFFFPRRDLPNALATVAYYVRIRKTAPEQGLYNGLQRLAYTSSMLIGLVAVLSGLAMYKPVQLAPLASMMGGYDNARVVHLASLFAFLFFTFGHLLMVLLHPRSFLAMITGGRRHG